MNFELSMDVLLAPMIGSVHVGANYCQARQSCCAEILPESIQKFILYISMHLATYKYSQQQVA